MKTLYTFFIIIFFLLISSQIIFAQSAPSTQRVPSATSEARFINVSYELPFPGILPDNPLYFLKALRDNLINFFITDPVKKAEYDLLMADKRLASANALMDKKNYQLAITTLSKSGNYFDQAIQLAAQAKTQGKDVNSVLSNLWIASQKHQQVIYQMSQKTKGDVKYNLELLQVRAKNFQDTVDVVRSQ
jgi:hypothetical protein